MKRCKVCRKKPRLYRRVNTEGILFCSDTCYDHYGEHPIDDIEHPYIDDYEEIRGTYIRWMEQYENWLYGYWLYGTPSKQKVLEDLEEYLWGFMDFRGLEGQDGVLSFEIYQYLIEFDELYDLILKWEPNGWELKRRRNENEEEYGY